MSFSTASHQLRKQLMFQLVQQSERDNCYQCGKKIESADVLSIEHKTPWLHSEDPVKMFFDLDNIAFSHTTCNYKNKRHKSVVNGKHGYKGINFMKSTKGVRNKPWRAMMTYEDKLISLGVYETPEEAAKAYDEAVIERFGDKAVTNKSLGLL